MTEMTAAPSRQEQSAGLSWTAARLTAHRAGLAAMLAEVTLPLWECDGGTLAGELRAACDLPSFPASAVDGYAVRGERTHLALVTRGPDHCGYPVAHAGSAMLRGLVQGAGFAVIASRQAADSGDFVPFVPLPLSAGEHVWAGAAAS